jgi:hypothetical protein
MVPEEGEERQEEVKPPEEAVEPGRNAVFSRVGAEVMESGIK